MIPESAIKAKIRNDLLHKRSAYYFAPVQMGMGITTLDILCCVGGQFVGIEVKVPGKLPTVRQLQTIKAIQGAGGIAFWCDSFEQYLKIMESYGL